MMIRPWHVVPLLVAASAGACFYWWEQEHELWNPPSALRPDLPKSEPLVAFAAVRAAQADARPIFWTTRRPVEKDEKKDNAMNELMSARLSAVFESGGSRIALLQRPDGTPMKITSTSSPWKIQSFDGRRGLFLSSDGQQVSRPLEAGAVVAPRGGFGPPQAQRGGNFSPAVPASNQNPGLPR